MLGATDRHFRNIVRFMSKRAFVYSELVHCSAVLHGRSSMHLEENAQAHPAALQLAGCVPDDFREAARMGWGSGFDEININFGCPSPKGVENNFGLCLMDDAHLAAACVKACTEGSPLPVTVKCRLGCRPDYTEDELLKFLDSCIKAGCRCFIVHARLADMQNYDTHKNRTLPELRFDRAYALKERWPELEWIVNGDIKTNEQAAEHLQHADGVMIGRAAYANIYMLSKVDETFFGDPPFALSRAELIKQKIIPYFEQEMAGGSQLSHFVRHVLGIYRGEPKANTWRRFLADNAYKPGAQVSLLRDALKLVEEKD